jgi:hypothetical protein
MPKSTLQNQRTVEKGIVAALRFCLETKMGHAMVIQTDFFFAAELKLEQFDRLQT